MSFILQYLKSVAFYRARRSAFLPLVMALTGAVCEASAETEATWRRDAVPAGSNATPVFALYCLPGDCRVFPVGEGSPDVETQTLRAMKIRNNLWDANTRRIQLVAARRETADFQIVMQRAVADVTDVDIHVSDLKVLWISRRSNHARPLKVINPVPAAVLMPDLFVVAMDKTTDAFDRKDGTLRWSVKRNHDVGAMTLAAAGTVVYTAASHSGIVQAIDSASGKLLWEHSLPGNEATECVSLLPMERRLVVGSRSPAPRIYCLENGIRAK